jgi:hypothetical protein
MRNCVDGAVYEIEVEVGDGGVLAVFVVGHGEKRRSEV